MIKDNITDAAIRFVEASMRASQAHYQRQPSPSSKRNLELAVVYHEAMAEMARAEVQLHDLVWEHKEEQVKQVMREAEEWKPEGKP